MADINLKRFVDIDIEQHVHSTVVGTRGTVVLYTSDGTAGTTRLIESIGDATAHYANMTQVGINITNASTIGSRSLYVNGTSYYNNTMEARTNAHHLGLKLGYTYLNAIDGSIIFQNNTAIRFGGDSWDYNV